MNQPPSTRNGQPSKPAQGVPKETLEKLAAKLKELVGEDFEMPSEQVRKPRNIKGTPITHHLTNK